MTNINAFDFLIVAIPCALCILACFVSRKPMEKMDFLDIELILFVSAVSNIFISSGRIVREKLCQIIYQIKRCLKNRWKTRKLRRGPI